MVELVKSEVRIDNKVDELQDQLKRLLRKLFQFGDDAAILDFGIYRIMNQKRAAIEQFIDRDLINGVETEFGKVSGSNKEAIKKDLEAIREEIRSTFGDGAIDINDKFSATFSNTPAGQKLAARFDNKKKEFANADASLDHRKEVYNHIYQFFSRYYDSGDFMSMYRRSTRQKYSIPYNGEEVMLHWANKDQYYIKTGEFFNNYSFRIGSYQIHFHITDAKTTQNNTKSIQTPIFILRSEDPVIYDQKTRTLTAFFEYRHVTPEDGISEGTRNLQEIFLERAETSIVGIKSEPGLKTALTNLVNEKHSLLRKHLIIYTKENTTDYFIHKRLKAFLIDELDFYIKNEMFHLADISSSDNLSIEQYLNQIRVMKAISLTIIDFLAQIEDFQKMLFEKKKFVVSSDYCITLDRLPETFYPEIIRTPAQIDEWKELYGIGGLGGQSTLSGKNGNPIDVDFLKAHQYLVLDTKFFSLEFKDRLLAIFNDLDDATVGLIVKSENWQALNLLQDRYREQVKCIYIDPPYNTGDKKQFNYKDNYQHSSWLAMMGDRINSAKNFLKPNGAFFSSIDIHEVSNLDLLTNEIFGTDGFFSILTIVSNFKGRSDEKNIATSHESLIMAAKKDFDTQGLPIPENYKQEYTLSDENGPYRLQGLRKRGSGSKREDRPNLWYPFYYNPETNDLTLNEKKGYIKILPKLSDGSDGRWRWEPDTVVKRLNELYVQKVSTRNEYDVFQKDYLLHGDQEKRVKPKSFWFDSRYSSDFGTAAYKKIMGQIPFSNPKSPELLKDIVGMSTTTDDIIMDFFAGSGTTAQAVIKLNSEDKGHRKYILVEMGDYFNSVMKPRIVKILYSAEWQDGIPQNLDGISHIFKYITLEQYEDTLNNIEFIEDGTVKRTLGDYSDYFIQYMLRFETKGSPCRLNIEKLERPFEYSLKVTENNEIVSKIVDLVDTFNYLLGIHVKKILIFDNKGTKYKVVTGEKERVTYTIIWRKTVDLDLESDKKFIEETILPKNKAEKIFINGDFYVERAEAIEPVFQTLMGA